MKIQTTAKVQITIEITSPSPWGGECSMEQIHKQAAADAVNRLGELFAASRLQMKFIAEPKVIATTMEKL